MRCIKDPITWSLVVYYINDNRQIHSCQKSRSAHAISREGVGPEHVTPVNVYKADNPQ